MATSQKGKQPDNSAKKPATRKKEAGAGVSAPLSQAERIELVDFDGVTERLSTGVTLTQIAKDAGVSIGFLLQWIAADENRSARAREARAQAAKLWDEKALDVIEQAADPFELQRARELAQHYRWRASKAAPKDYGDKMTQEVTGANGGALQVASTVTFVRPPVRNEA